MFLDLNTISHLSTLILDIDGTLSKTTGRERYLEGFPKNWDAFYDAVDTDVPIDGSLDGVRYISTAVRDVVYLTGRAERCRDKTFAWLRRHGYPSGFVHMRPDHDFRSAVNFKMDVVRGWDLDLSKILVVDDDVNVVAALRQHGVRCLVAPACWREISVADWEMLANESALRK